MSIGLFDFDMYNYCPFPYNLEIMKLATYYKQHNQLVSLSPGFYPESYTKFIVRKDVFDDRYIPNLMKYNNVEYGGYGYTNGIYIPLKEEIELSRPDYGIYNKVRLNYEANKTSKEKWLLMQNAVHTRLSLNGKTVWSEFLKPLDFTNKRTNTFIHDFNVTAIKDADLAIQELMDIYKGMGKKFVMGLGYKFPIQVSSFDEIYKWYNIGGRGAYKNFQFNGIMEDEEIESTLKLLSHENLMKMIYKVDLPSNATNQEIIDIIRKIYYQAVFLCNNRGCLSLIIGDNFPEPEKWQNVFDCWNCFMYCGQIHHKDYLEKRKDFETLFNYCKRTKHYSYKREGTKNKTLSIETMREVFNFIGNFDYELFKDFYTLNSVELKGGRFVFKRITI